MPNNWAWIVPLNTAILFAILCFWSIQKHDTLFAVILCLVNAYLAYRRLKMRRPTKTTKSQIPAARRGRTDGQRDTLRQDGCPRLRSVHPSGSAKPNAKDSTKSNPLVNAPLAIAPFAVA
jgi:hypothetical protein